MPDLTLGEAAAFCGGTVAAEAASISFFGACADSRKLLPGQLFVALTDVRDGHDFAPDAMAKGAAAVLGERPLPGIPVLVAPDARRALGAIARGRRERLPVKVVGITGSVGKTTTKEMTAQVLAAGYRIHATPENFNNDIGLPCTVLGIPEDCELAVIEMGMNHFGELSYLTRIAQPDVAVITNIGTMHIENLGSREGILRAKLEILEGLRAGGTVVFNGDEPLLRAAQTACKPVLFGIDTDCDLRASGIESFPGGLRFRVTGLGADFELRLPVEGRHHVYDALAATAVGLLCGLKPAQIAAALAEFENTGDRQRSYEHKGFFIIADCYNAGPESMAAALDVLSARQTGGRRIAVLGDMLELGSFADEAHFRVGRLAGQKADCVFAYGPHAALVVQGAREAGAAQAEAFDTHEALAEALRRTAKPGDVLLFKGSHGMHMQRALALFSA